MEQQNHQTTNDNINTTTNHQDTNTNKTANNNGNSGNGGGFLCSRQSSSRWTPTTEQIRILKELYYNNGVRSPSAEQIQRISARLRQYGKIEGKNVFYWFQNHKARERQKKRFTADIHHNNNNINIIRNNNNNNNINYNTSATTSSTVGIINTNNTIITTGSACKTHHHHDQYDDDDDQHHQEYQLFHHHGASHIKYSNNFSPVVSYGMSCSSSSISSTSVVGVNGQMGNVQYGYGGVTNMDKAFRECGSSGGVNGGSITQNFGWVGSSDPFSSPYGLLDKRSNIALEDDDHDHDYHDDHDHDQASPEIETLPLFPMHGDGGYGNMMIKPNFSDPGAAGYYPGWYRSDDGSGAGGHVSTRTSLELSLNSYGHISPNSL